MATQKRTVVKPPPLLYLSQAALFSNTQHVHVFFVSFQRYFMRHYCTSQGWDIQESVDINEDPSLLLCHVSTLPEKRKGSRQ